MLRVERKNLCAAIDEALVELSDDEIVEVLRDVLRRLDIKHTGETLDEQFAVNEH